LKSNYFPLLLVLLLFPATTFASGGLSAPADSTTGRPAIVHDTLLQFNEAGSFGHYFNGVKASVKAGLMDAAAGYSYLNDDGYRAHSNQYAHRFSLDLKTTPAVNTLLQVTAVYFHGSVKQPGALTLDEFEKDPWQADPRAVNRDQSRVTTRGEVGVSYRIFFGRALNQKIRIAGTGKIENFLRSTREYKVINHHALNLDAEYVSTFRIGKMGNEFSAGGTLFSQPERREIYENFTGKKSDILEQIKSERISRMSGFLADRLEIIHGKLFLNLAGRFNQLTCRITEQIAPSRDDRKIYHALTPEAGLEYRPLKILSVSAGYRTEFRSPTEKELESFNPAYMYNQDLEAQESKILEAVIRANLPQTTGSRFVRTLHGQARLFYNRIGKEMVTYEFYGEDFYRNAGRADRTGLSLEGRMEVKGGFGLSAGWDWTRCTYKDYSADMWESDASGNLTLVSRDFSGKSEPGIPQNRVAVTLDYRRDLGKHARIGGNASFVHHDRSWADDANTGRIDAFNVANLALFFDLHLRRFFLSASAGVNNLTDARYSGETNINSVLRRYYSAGAPRNYSGSVAFGYIF